MDRNMLKERSLLTVVLSVLLCGSLSVWAAGTIKQQTFNPALSANPAAEVKRLLSPSVGERFYEIAYELAGSDEITSMQAEQAIIFLIAAKELGCTDGQILPLLIRLACDYSEYDYSKQIYRWLEQYISEPAEGGPNSVQAVSLVDIEILRKAVTYLLDRANSREQREILLEQMLAELGSKNATLDSELATSLGLLMMEKADFKTAQTHFLRAYFNNTYNKLAFAKLVELAPNQIGPTMYISHLRLLLRENPIDIEAALSFAQYAEQLQLYDIASVAYEYCADLFAYLYPNEALPANIYLPWIISFYNTEQNRYRCLQIAERIRQSGRFDILVEAIAGKAAVKIGDTEGANRIFQAAELKAQQLLNGKFDISAEDRFGAKQLAWFYCFARQDAPKALDWANKAYSTDPNSPVGAALLAYALVMNQQLEWAKPLIEHYEHNQISELVQAQLQLTDGKRDYAIESLNSAIAKDPGSLAAERAKEILVQQGEAYVPPINSDIVLTMLSNSFGQSLFPEFKRPSEILSVRFNTSGNEFSFGSEFGPPAQITIVNNSSEPLVISDDGLFRGKIRIDADISGDLNKKMPKLISRSIGCGLSIEPGKSISISVGLCTGELRRVLRSFPQASLNIEFTLYLDPVRFVQTGQDKIINRLFDIKPVKVELRRPGVELTSEYLQNRFNSISVGQIGPKIRIAELFVGLLKEQQTMAEHGTLYRYKYADWMSNFCKSALLQDSGLLLNSAEQEWVVKVHTMAEMLSLHLDYQLINTVAKNLNLSQWPVRMMAVYLLAKSPDSNFDRVLDWIAQNDSSRLIRYMAVALSAGIGVQNMTPQ